MWPWIRYKGVSDSVICFYCSNAHERKLLPEGLYGKRGHVSQKALLTEKMLVLISGCMKQQNIMYIDAVKAMTKPQNDVG